MRVHVNIAHGDERRILFVGFKKKEITSTPTAVPAIDTELPRIGPKRRKGRGEGESDE